MANRLLVLALAPAGEVVGGAIGQVLDRLDVGSPSATSIAVVIPGSRQAGRRRRAPCAWLSSSASIFSRCSRARVWISAAVFSSKPSIEAISDGSTKATSSTELKPSEASNWAMTSSTSSASMKSSRALGELRLAALGLPTPRS